ncbi:MAG: hypothetical protein KGL39_17950 [Patescibacteria group bacterium]|nr:hypothetical protein [Patescibacteria group bacterium]
MTIIIDCTTPEKIDSFCDSLVDAMKDNIVDFARAAKTHKQKMIFARSIEFRHGLEAGNRVEDAIFRDRKGTIKEIVVCDNGNYTFGKCRVDWDNGSVTEEHPEHLSRIRSKCI